MIQRGEIWWASLPEPRGSEPGHRRPVLVIQSDSFNRSNIQTVIAVVITSNTALSEAPGNVLLPKKDCGLSKLSVVNVSQMITLDKSYLRERVRKVPQRVLSKVEEGIRLVLSI